MATIGNLYIKVVVDARLALSELSALAQKVAKFGDNTTQLSGVLSTFSNGVMKVGSVITQVIGALGEILKTIAKFTLVILSVAGVLIKLAKHLNDNAYELVKFSITMGLSVQQAVQFKMAAERVGISFQLMHRFLSRMNRSIGELLEGAPKAVVALKQLGAVGNISVRNVGGRALQELGFAAADFAGNTFENFKKISNAIAALPTPAERAAMAFRIFGRNAEQVLLIIQKGGDFLDRMQTKAENFGLSFNNIDAGKIEAANEAWQDIFDIVRGIGIQLAIAVAPIVIAIADNINRWMDGANGFRGSMFAVIEGLAHFFGFIADLVNGVMILFGFVKLGILTVMLLAVGAVKLVLDFINLLIDALNKLPKVNIDNVDTSRINETIDNMKAKIKETGDDVNKRIGHKPSDDINDWLEKVKNKSDEIGKKWDQNQKKMGGAGLEAGRHLFEMMERGARITDEMRTPVEQLGDTFRELEEMVANGAIGLETFERASQKAFASAIKAVNAGQVRLTGADQFNTTGAVSAIIRAQVQDREAGKTPQERMEGLLREQLAIQNAMKEYQRQTVDSLRGGVRQGQL